MKRAPVSELIRRAAQTMAAAYMKQEPGLTLPQAGMLRALVSNGPSSQTALRSLSGADRSTASTLLQRLAGANLVVNVRLQEDQRVLLVTITPAGLAALERAEAALATAELEVLKLIPRVKRPYFKDALQHIADGAKP